MLFNPIFSLFKSFVKGRQLTDLIIYDKPVLVVFFGITTRRQEMIRNNEERLECDRLLRRFTTLMENGELFSDPRLAKKAKMNEVCDLSKIGFYIVKNLHVMIGYDRDEASRRANGNPMSYLQELGEIIKKYIK